MKKVALLLATLMVISLLPMATFAADLTVADDNLTITAIDGASSTDVTSKLTDGITFNYAQEMARNVALSNHWKFDDSNNANYVHQFANSTTDKVLEFNWEGGKAVRRIDVWFGWKNCCTGFKVQTFDGTNWNDVALEFSPRFGGTPASNQADYHAFLLDNPIPSDSEKLRVVFTGVSAAIYVTEARISTDNNFNLIGYGVNENIITGDGAFRTQGAYQSYMATAFYSNNLATAAVFSNFTYDDASVVMNYGYLNEDGNDRNYGLVWPAQMNTPDKRYLTANALGELWYAVQFSGRNPLAHYVQANRIRVNMNSGNAQGFEVYFSNGVANAWNNIKGSRTNQYNKALNRNNWTKLATYDGYVSGANYVELDIPSTKWSGEWMIRFLSPSENAQVANIQMYRVADEELNKGTTLTGEVAPGNTVTLKGCHVTPRNGAASTVAVMFGLYDGDKLVGIAKGGTHTMEASTQVDFNTNYVASYTIPEDYVAEGELTVKAFLWNNMTDLQPLQAPITLAQ